MGLRLDNFPIIKNSQENDTEALDYFRIFIHGAFLQKSMNFETNLAENCDSVQNFVTVLGNYDYTGLICIQDEIMNVTSSEIIDENTTKFSVDRAYLGSDGEAKVVNGINVSHIELLGSKSDSPQSAPPKQERPQSNQSNSFVDGPGKEEDDSDLPF